MSNAVAETSVSRLNGIGRHGRMAGNLRRTLPEKGFSHFSEKPANPFSIPRAAFMRYPYLRGHHITPSLHIRPPPDAQGNGDIRYLSDHRSSSKNPF